MFEIYNKYGFDHFRFESYEITIMKYSNNLCCVDGFNNIKVNQEFMSLDINTQKFVLYHELGHIHYKHNSRQIIFNKIYKFKRKIYFRLGLVVKEEIQADKYAVKQLGKVKALKAIRETINLFKSQGLVTKELETRELLIKLFR